MASPERENSSMITSEQYYMSLQQPPSVRFQPTDQELITHFLTRRANNGSLPMNLIIDEFLFYNYSPEQLSQMYGFANQKEMYFFTGAVRKYSDAVIPQRTAGDGFWKSTSPYLYIRQGGEKIGVKKSSRFYAGSEKDSTKTNWVMLEYRNNWEFMSVIEDQHVWYDWILCKVYEKKSNANAKRVPDWNNRGKAAEEVAGEQLRPRITFPSEDEYERKTRRWVSKDSGKLPLAMSTRSYQRPCLPELPFEVIIEILSWLPVESVLRFKCVCMQWCSLFQEDEFIAKHRVRASPIQLPYKLKWEADRLVTLYDENFKLISRNGGLFFEKSLASQVYRIRNFAMHQVLYLPVPVFANTSTPGFSLNSSTGEGKVTNFYCENIEGDFYGELGFNVITVGKDEQWRTLKLPNQNAHTKRLSLILEGAAHEVEIIRSMEQDLYLEIQSLDLWSECFFTNTLPRGVFVDLDKVFLLLWNRRLAVGEIAEETFNVMVLEDFKAHKWSETKMAVPLKSLKDNTRLKNEIPRIIAVFHELILIDFDTGEKKNHFVYNMKTEILREIENPEAKGKHLALLKPSLTVFKGMRLKF